MGAVPLVATSLSLLTAPPAGAAIRPAYVIPPQAGTIANRDNSGGANVRGYWGGLGASVIGHANNGDQVTVSCYVSSDAIDGDPYWDLVTDPSGDPSGVQGFVTDAYVDTGADITTQVDYCGIIEGIGGVNVRDRWGGFTSPVIGHANNQDQVTVNCYLKEDTVNGDPYWDLIDDPNGYYVPSGTAGVEGFVADAYVDTNGDITTQVPECDIPEQ
jgi:hypothetical protein